MLKIGFINAERWISIFGEWSFDKPDEFVELIKGYQEQLSGEIKVTSEDMQYTISNDPLNLIFQWDSCFGITVIVPITTDILTAQEILQKLCDTLNQQSDKQKNS